MLITGTRREGRHEEIPKACNAESLIKTMLSNKMICQKEVLQLEFILRCAAVIGGKWSRVKKKNGKTVRPACDKAVALLDMAFAACVLNTHGQQWTRNDSKMRSDSGKDSNANEEVSPNKTDITAKKPAKKRKRISCEICKEFVDKHKKLKKELMELEKENKACEALGEWMEKREREREEKKNTGPIDEDNDEEEDKKSDRLMVKKMASEWSIAVQSKILLERFHLKNTV